MDSTENPRERKYPDGFYDGAGLTRAQRRRVLKLDMKLEKVHAADKKFFERHPDRRHFVRLAGIHEIEVQSILNKDAHTPEGHRQFVAVKKIAGGRVRLRFTAHESLETDLSEEDAGGLWRRLCELDELGRIALLCDVMGGDHA